MDDGDLSVDVALGGAAHRSKLIDEARRVRVHSKPNGKNQFGIKNKSLLIFRETKGRMRGEDDIHITSHKEERKWKGKDGGTK